MRVLLKQKNIKIKYNKENILNKNVRIENIIFNMNKNCFYNAPAQQKQFSFNNSN